MYVFGFKIMFAEHVGILIEVKHESSFAFANVSIINFYVD